MDCAAFTQKAVENLVAARLCFDNAHYNACVNRSYYAMFQAAVTVLIRKGFSPGQGFIGHDWLQATFARELIHRRKVFANTFRNYLYDAQTLRNTADYYDINVSKKAAAKQLKCAEEFVTTIHKELKIS